MLRELGLKKLLIPLAASLALVGCSSANTNAFPDTSSQPQESSWPKITNPLDITAFQKDPCAALSQEKLISFLGPQAKSEPDVNSPVGPACSWISSNGRAQPSVDILFGKLANDGISRAYRQKNDVAFFQDLEPIQGYPVVSFNYVDERAQGRCTTLLGLNDHQDAQISIWQSKDAVGKQDPCAEGHDVAIAMVETIKGAR